MLTSTSNEHCEKEIKKTIPVIRAPKRINYLGINVFKKAKDLYTENSTTLLQAVKEGPKKC